MAALDGLVAASASSHGLGQPVPQGLPLILAPDLHPMEVLAEPPVEVVPQPAPTSPPRAEAATPCTPPVQPRAAPATPPWRRRVSRSRSPPVAAQPVAPAAPPQAPPVAPLAPRARVPPPPPPPPPAPRRAEPRGGGQVEVSWGRYGVEGVHRCHLSRTPRAGSPAPSSARASASARTAAVCGTRTAGGGTPSGAWRCRG